MSPLGGSIRLDSTHRALLLKVLRHLPLMYLHLRDDRLAAAAAVVVVVLVVVVLVVVAEAVLLFFFFFLILFLVVVTHRLPLCS